jgi:hypothetical protein
MFRKFAAVAAFAVAGTGASASSITITGYGTGADLNAALGAYAVVAQEDFERFGSDPANAGVVFETGTISREASPGINFGELTSAGIDTLVGNVSTHGSFTGTGSTCQKLDLNNDNCTNIALQYNPDLNGQGNIVPVGGAWSLNAADTGGFEWAAFLGGTTFNTIIFALRDAADQGATVSVSADVGGSVVTESKSGLGNDNLQLIAITFSSFVSFADITIASSKANDSMTIDGLTLAGVQPPPGEVPLPASGLLLLGAFGALALRRKKA